MYCFNCGVRVNENDDFCHKCGSPISTISVQTSPLEKLGEDGSPHYIGKYRIEKKIGIGGMGVVYQAYDENLKRMVAIKILPTRLAKRKGYPERFQAEAHRSAELEHPNIVMIHDVGSDQGRTYFVMNLLTGKSLEKLVGNNPIDIKTGCQILVQLLRALGYAHSKGVIHCDIKPGNVIIGGDDHVTLLDFGIAKAASTKENTAVGTPEYMSPEQCQGKPVDARSDIYGLGILMYKLFTRRLPFTADKKVAVAFKQINEPPIAPKVLEQSIPEWLNDIILRCMSKMPQDRYQTTAELANDLDAGLRRIYAEEKLAKESKPQSRLSGKERWRYRRRPVVGIILGMLLAAGLTWGTIATLRYIELNEQQNEEVESSAELVITEGEVILEVTTRPSDAQIFINERSYGKSPIKTRLPRGETYLIAIEKDDYKPRELEILLGDKDIYQVVVELTPASFGYLQLVGPDKAQVWVDNQYLGTLPLNRMRLFTGEHLIRVVSEEKEVTREVYITKNATKNVDITREPAVSSAYHHPLTNGEETDSAGLEEAESILLGD